LEEEAMKNLMPACGFVLLGLSSTAHARGGGRQGNQVTINNVEVMTSAGDEFDVSHPFLTIKLDVQVSGRTRGDITVETECRAEGSVRTDSSNLVDDLSSLEMGETKHIEASPFARSRLSGPPSHCSISIRQTDEHGSSRDVASYCYASGHVTRGACR
jgi:hypothetical protein